MKIQRDTLDLSAKICALRQSMMQLIKEVQSTKEQKAIFGITLLMSKLERDATRIADQLDLI